ncbi:F-box domain-containing protein [Mycena chlorophos]|uniref:F-box domain-containing protein n=1 Tax=Mycena chlorophos TaxID=658473 RepID=A0A8H6TK70_MYCCL|nr:F-box domain-containing protein [Mycena chlorophos]
MPIHGLALELLSAIFSELRYANDNEDLVAASCVCSLWRAVATNNPNLWRDIFVARRSVSRRGPQVLRSVLQRSEPLSIRLHINWQDSPYAYGTSRYPSDRNRVVSTFFNVILPHVNRCELLDIAVGPEVWKWLCDEYYYPEDLDRHNDPIRHPAFPLLSTLSLNNLDSTPQWQRTIDEDDGPSELRFPMLTSLHHLQHVTLIGGFTLWETNCPSIEHLECYGNIPFTAWPDSSLFSSPRHLTLSNLCVPVPERPHAEDFRHVVNTSNVQHLELIKLSTASASISILSPEARRELDGTVFFYQLDTSHVRVLFIDTWNSRSNICKDFIRVLKPTQSMLPNGDVVWVPIIKFPQTTELMIRGIEPFLELCVCEMAPCKCLTRLFATFPLLEYLEIMPLNDKVEAGVCEVVVGLLKLKPELCPRLQRIRVGEHVVLRDDPLMAGLEGF